MQHATRMSWLRGLEVFDRARVFPRIVLLAYGYYVYQVTFFILVWYSSQPKEARGTEESAVVIAVVTAVTGFAPWIFKIYATTGGTWNTATDPSAPLDLSK